MEELYYLISDAAKQVKVETHVLRYWEEELHLPIQRNKQGHRHYTLSDVNRFKQIKEMKERGFQLKAIRNALDGKAVESMEKPSELQFSVKEQPIHIKQEYEVVEDKETKAMRLQMLLKHMISEAVRENNIELGQDIKSTVLKELDYQFRLQEEREEEREKDRIRRDEEHYKKLDEILREKSLKGKRKKHSIF